MRNYCKALRSSPGFIVDQPPNDDTYTAEIFAMVRDNGRILDDFKCVIGGTDILEADFMQSRQALQQPGHRSHTIRMQRWTRDLDLRKGPALLFLEGPVYEFLRIMEDPENGLEALAVCWAVRLSWSSYCMDCRRQLQF